MSLAAGYSATCAAVPGGATKLYIANASDITSMTLTGEDYSAITMVATKVFYEFDVQVDTLQFLENVTRGDKGGFGYEHMVNAWFANMTSTQTTALQSLLDCSPCGLVVVVQTNTGDQRVLGYSETFTTTRGAYMNTIESDSGLAITDDNGSQVQIKSTSDRLARITTADMSTLI